MTMGWACSTHDVVINTNQILVGKPEGKRELERHGRRWEEKIKIDLNEIGYIRCGMDSSGSG
jgi:hypothetical protein